MHYKHLLVFTLIFSLLNLIACSHSKSFSKSDIEKGNSPQIGDEVVVVNKNGDKHKIILTEVTEDSLKSIDYNIAIKDIQSIKKIEKPPYLLIGILVGIGLLYMIGKGLSGGIGPH